MPRANRHFLPGQLWHLTHRCHEKAFLLKFARDRRRYTLIELAGLSALCGFTDVGDFQRAHRQWVAEALTREAEKRDERWSGAVAVGSEAFVEKVKRELGMKAQNRDIDEADGAYVLREPGRAYTTDFGTENDTLRPRNTIPWARSPVIP
jgi:hypothetical protein